MVEEFDGMFRTALGISALVALCGATSCSSAGSDTALADDVARAPTRESGPVFTHKMMRNTGENKFAALGYECPQCTFEQWLAIEPPEGWTKGPAQVLLAQSGELRSYPSIEGIPDTMDFIEEVPGNEYRLIVKNLDGRIIGFSGSGLVVEVTVMRDNMIRYDAGQRVHELTAPDGNVFVLFAHGVDPENVVIPNAQDPGMLGDFSPPEGYIYSSRILAEPLILDTSDTATVLAFRGTRITTWEQRTSAAAGSP